MLDASAQINIAKYRTLEIHPTTVDIHTQLSHYTDQKLIREQIVKDAIQKLQIQAEINACQTIINDINLNIILNNVTVRDGKTYRVQPGEFNRKRESTSTATVHHKNTTQQ